eukprot:GDKJ01021279.1.p1 GENE.GDKJ01021279.1~~GDKJ01021279.1.p1  ORF type:complete len:1269 (+),score=238.56 GDKJ01021279.1:265-3807(+)
MKKSWAAYCQVYFPCKQNCKPDFTIECPKFWRNIDGQCIAPASYQGGCDKAVSMSRFSTALKMAFQIQCQVQWPCNDRAKYDLSKPCPHGWNYLPASDKCAPHPTYRGPKHCVNGFSPSQLSFSDRFQWGRDCNAPWPPLSNCPKAYDLPCPDAWDFDKRTRSCVASPSYSGKCPREMVVSHWNTAMKAAFESACGASWPCDSESTRNKLMDLLKDLREGAGVNSGTSWGSVDDLSGIIVQPGKPLATMETFLKVLDSAKEKAKNPVQSESAELSFRQTVDNAARTAQEEQRLDVRPDVQDATEAMDHSVAEELAKLEQLKEKRRRARQQSGYSQQTISTSSFLQIRTNPITQKPNRAAPLFQPSISLPSSQHTSFVQGVSLQNFFENGGYSLPADASQLVAEVRDLDVGAMALREELRAGYDLFDGSHASPLCEKDFLAICPVDWIPFKGYCYAPPGYLGKCSRVQSFAGLSSRWDRIGWAEECEADWPCVKCQHDYESYPCPMGWHLLLDGSCEKQPITNRLMSDLKSSEQENEISTEAKEDSGKATENEVENKKQRGDKLRAEKKGSKSDFQVEASSDETLQPPQTLIPQLQRCSSRVDFRGWTVREKKRFSQLCFVDWPCRRNCEPDVSRICPVGWMKIDYYSSDPTEEQRIRASKIRHNLMAAEEPEDNSLSDIIALVKEMEAKKKQDEEKEEEERERAGGKVEEKPEKGKKLTAKELKREKKAEKLRKPAFEPSESTKTRKSNHIDVKKYPQISKADFFLKPQHPVYCIPIEPDEYIGPCTVPLRLPDTPIARVALARHCNLNWGCQSKCSSKIYQARCPIDWRYDFAQKDCIAPITYSGPCPRRQSLDEWSLKAKEEWATACAVDFPCDKELPGNKNGFKPSVLDRNAFRFNYTQIQFEKFLDENRFDIAQMTQTLNFHRCNTETGVSHVNYRNACPDDWKEMAGGPVNRGICIPPQKYNGPCVKAPTLLRNFDGPMKAEFSRRCHVSWPCSKFDAGVIGLKDMHQLNSDAPGLTKMLSLNAEQLQKQKQMFDASSGGIFGSLKFVLSNAKKEDVSSKNEVLRMIGELPSIEDPDEILGIPILRENLGEIVRTMFSGPKEIDALQEREKKAEKETKLKKMKATLSGKALKQFFGKYDDLENAFEEDDQMSQAGMPRTGVMGIVDDLPEPLTIG